jgi:hypothetical protein
MQAPIFTVEAVTRGPHRGHAGRRRPRQCALGQLKLGRKTPSEGDPSPSTARAVVGPCLRQGQLAVQQGMALAPLTRQKDADLAVLDRTRGAAVLAGYTRRIAAFLRKPVLLRTNTAFASPKMLDQIGAQFVTHRAGLPSGYVVAYAAGHRRDVSPLTSANATDFCVPPEGGMNTN